MKKGAKLVGGERVVISAVSGGLFWSGAFGGAERRWVEVDWAGGMGEVGLLAFQSWFWLWWERGRKDIILIVGVGERSYILG